jgi:phosphopantothenoylcysteine decarboxylase/phosphopantothenate--cysteine ligase
MWLHAATRRNVQQLIEDGVRVIEPAEGEMACGEHGPGRLPEPQDIVKWLASHQFLPRSAAAGEGDHAEHGGGG